MLDYKRSVLFLLKELKNKDVHHIGVLQQIEEVVRNKKNTDDYVYKFIYSLTSQICSKDAELIVVMLGEEGRL